jgi:AraC family ethanolamine operon transcriptional activator
MQLSAPARHLVSHDIDEHADSLTGWQQRYDQITGGRFEGSLVELCQPKLQLFRETTSHVLQQSCEVPAGSFWFGLPQQRDGTRINGRATDADCLLLRPGGCAFELHTPGQFAILGLVVERDLLSECALDRGYRIDWQRLAGAEFMRVPAAARQDFVSASQRCLSSERAPDTDAVLGALFAMLSPCQPAATPSLSFARRQKVVAQVRAYLLLHRDEAIGVPELCTRMHVSRRTLQYCFEDVLGMSPTSYLRMERLNGARRHLREGAPQHRSVQDVAAGWGFWHFSQFACDYRKLFGERPSDTFKRHAATLN